MTLTLVVLAAGMGSRFGGNKQMAGIGPSGEYIIDYSVFDAWRAGFQKVVFITRKELEAELREHFASSLEGRMEMEIVCQDKNNLPGGYTCPDTRIKPWGTGHAVWVGRNCVKGPFAAINGDDFYGRHAFKLLAEHLTRNPEQMTMVAFQLNRTLSEFGSVARGICQVSAERKLEDIEEMTNIKYVNGKLGNWNNDDTDCVPLRSDDLVSMNFWGFPAVALEHLTTFLTAFLEKNVNEPKKECYLPSFVDNEIKNGDFQVDVLESPDQWFGLTYAADRDAVVAKLGELTDAGIYPVPLWKR